MKVFFAGPAKNWDAWSGPLCAACPEMELKQDGPPDSFDAIIYAPNGPIDDFSEFKNVKVVQNLWAGVERVADNPTLTQPLARMVDSGLCQGMIDYCAGWTLRAHLGMDHFAQDGIWRNDQPAPLATERHVTILGMGELGRAVGQALSALGFQVSGWSASGRSVEGLTVFGSGDLDLALARAEILINLLPDTPQTTDLLAAPQFATMPRGAWFINPGRGSVIVDHDLIAALDSGHLAHAVLDVFRVEPLPPDHVFWHHQGITVTPHIAADTRLETASRLVAENLRRAMKGEPILHLVDRHKGY